MSEKNRSQDRERDLEQLREFVRVVSRMGHRRFIKDLAQQDQTVHFGSELKGPHYDLEDLEAFLTDFRKVAMLQGESVYLTKMLITVGKLASDELRSKLKKWRPYITGLLDGRVSLMNIGYDRDDFEARLSEQQIVDALVNGEIFHTDPDHATTAKLLRQQQPLFYLWPAVHGFIMPVFKVCVWLHHALWHDGILERDDYPADCRPPERRQTKN